MGAPLGIPSARTPAAALAAAALFVLSGCGSSTPPKATVTAHAINSPTTTAPPGGSASARSVSLVAAPDGEPSFDKDSLLVKAGEVEIAFTNDSPVNHGLIVARRGGIILAQTPPFRGGTRVLRLKGLEPGQYLYYATLPRQRRKGMEGLLTAVKP